MNRLLASIRLALGNKFLTGGLLAAAGISFIGGAVPASAATHMYKVVPDLNAILWNDWANCDTKCRDDLRSSDGVYVNPYPVSSTMSDIPETQWPSIMAVMTNNSAWPVYAEETYDCTFVVLGQYAGRTRIIATDYSMGALAAKYAGRLDGFIVYHETGLPTCGDDRTQTNIPSSKLDTFPSNTLDNSQLAVVGSLYPGNVSVAGKIVVHARAYDENSEGGLTRAQRIDAALGNANTGGLIIEQNPHAVSIPGLNIVQVLNKAISLGKGAALLVPPVDGEQNYLGKIHTMMKYLETNPNGNLLAQGVWIVPAAYSNPRLGIPYANAGGLPSNSLRAVIKHLKNARAKGLSYANDNNFAVTGWLDAVERVPGGVVVRGWACAKNWEDSINVHIYVENTAVKSVTANRVSEGPIAAACSSTGTAYRYYETFSETDRIANAGKRVYVYGISPFDLANNGLNGNGKIVPY